jgi:hypothetical protein
VLDEGAETYFAHSKWTLVGKVLSPSTLHISTISAALRPAWGNPRGLLLNPGGVNIFVAEFATKTDMDRVLDGPPWVVGTHAVLLQGFNVDLKPSELIFNRMKVWVRILNLPFGYMQKRSGSVIAGSIGVEGSVPVVDCDASGRCWGSYMRVRVEIDVDKPLRRGVTVFSQRRNATDWFELQYEDLPRYCFSCGMIGHSSTACLNPGERDAHGRHPYSADFLCAPDERKKKTQGAQSSSGSVPAGLGRSSSPTKDRSNQPGNIYGDKKKSSEPEVTPPGKKKQAQPRAKANKSTQGSEKDQVTGQDGKVLAGQKRKKVQVYKAKTIPMLTAETVHPLDVVVHNDGSAPVVDEFSSADAASNDSNKKRRSETIGSADQAGAVEQPRRTQ